MWFISRLRDQRFCAFCKSPRRIYVKKHVDVTNVVGAMVFAFVVTFGVWGDADPRALLIFCLFIVGAEIFVYLRWRTTLTCNLCGFDPVLYKKSPARASLRVKDFFAAQVENPEFWLTKSPLLRVQKGVRLAERKAIERAITAKRTKVTSLAPPKSL